MNETLEKWMSKKQKHRKISDGIWVIAMLVVLVAVIYAKVYTALPLLIPAIAYKLASFAGVFDKRRKQSLEEEEEMLSEQASAYQPQVERFHKNETKKPYKTWK